MTSLPEANFGRVLSYTPGLEQGYAQNLRKGRARFTNTFGHITNYAFEIQQQIIDLPAFF